MKSQESQRIISLVGSTGEEMQSWVAVSVIFPILCTNGGSVHTREKPLKASLVTFLANDLGTECPYPGIIREDLREGRCEEGTNCDQTKDVQDTELWGSPWVLSAPVGGKTHPASNVYVGEHNRTAPPHHVKDNLVTWESTVQLPCQGRFGDQGCSRLSIVREWPRHQGDSGARRATPELATGGCKRFSSK